MTRYTPTALALALLLPSGTVWAQQVELAPFAGLQFGGSLGSLEGGSLSLGASFAYGATLDVAFNESWKVEALYSRDETRVEGTGIEIRVERIMAGLVEEHHHGRTRFFGVGLLGATRLVPPSGYSSAALFTLALGLGVKHHLSDRLGIRAEARGFYTVTYANEALFCRGGCLFFYSSSGLVQGDVSAGVFLAF